MLIIADENIPYAREAFGILGEVRLAAGRGLDRNAVREADALLVRSVTRVNAALLEGSRIKFVGTATIGTDHIDLPYLQQKGIAFASAAGCNANSVAEYVVAALLHLAVHREIVLEGMTLGIVGAGNVGSRVAEKARALGLEILLNDPPLAALLHSTQREALPLSLQQNVARLSPSNDLPQFLPLEDLKNADVITLHTPLVRTGPHPTFHLFEEARLRTMKTDSLLINTARGEVIDNLALKKILRAGMLSAAILDVWEHEPHVDPELVELTTLATPHIAGYSFDGKLKGTLLIYEALCRFLEVKPEWNYAPLLPPVAQPEIDLRADEMNISKASRKIPTSRGAVECHDSIHAPKQHDDLQATDSEKLTRAREHPPQGRNDAAMAQDLLHEAVCHAYDIAADDKRLRKGVLRLDSSKEERGEYFDKLRHEYPIRREFSNYRVKIIPALMKPGNQLSAMGFQVIQANGLRDEKNLDCS